MIKSSIIFLFVLFSYCTPKKTFNNFDSAAWKQDKLACTGTRQAMENTFENIRRELLGLSQEALIDVLGKPDFQLLHRRSQKYYVYFLEKGVQCQGKTDTSKARTVSIRFNAVGLATEIVYGQGKPT